VPPEHRLDDTTRARLLLVVISLAWGVNWPVIKIGLEELSPLSYRLCGYAVGSVALVVLVTLQGRSLAVPRGRMWLHIMIASLLNIVAFGLFSAFAQLTASTGRVAMVSYSFPVWTAALAWLVLGETLTRNAAIGLLLCTCGLAVLIYPVLHSDALIGLSLSVACAMTWAVATIYLKVIRLPGDLVITTWQVIFAFVVMVVLVPLFQGPPSFELTSARSIFAVVFSGLVGTCLAYALWYHVIQYVPAMTASIGVLAAPVVGVISASLVLGEMPTVSDMIGFALVFAAAACVILQPRERPPVTPAET
jgi:drug/metabolite transporter (DMT)-like permease